MNKYKLLSNDDVLNTDIPNKKKFEFKSRNVLDIKKKSKVISVKRRVDSLANSVESEELLSEPDIDKK